MILKKPYAFLIKNFKKIHLIMSIAMGYLIYKTYVIYAFFKESALNNYYASLDYEERNLYVNFFVLFIIILIIGALIAIYYLLNHKKKPRKIYVFSLGVYIVLFIYYVVLNGVFKGLVESNIEMQAIRAYQDISLIAIMPQIALLIYMIITAIGINLKKFNFAADLKELDITAGDNEEVEVSISFDGYKTKRSVRRTIREFGYYVKENKFIITCIGVVLAFIFGFITIRAIIKKGGNLLANQSAVSNKFTIKVQDSIISNLKPNGEVINDGNYYLVVKINIKNITNTNVALDYSNYHLTYKKNNITPTLSASQYFYDFAFPYLGDELRPSEERTISLAFEIDKSDINSNFTLKAYKGSTTSDKKLKANYNEIKLNPKMQFDIGDANRVSVNEELSFSNSNVGNTTLKITNYSFDSNYKYTYEVCNEDICNPKTDIITPDYLSSNKSAYLMILDYEFKLDDQSIYAKYNSDFRSFVTNFMKVKYVKNGQTYYSNAISRTPDNLTDKEIVQIDKDVVDSNEIQLVFTIRNRNYTVVVK